MRDEYHHLKPANHSDQMIYDQMRDNYNLVTLREAVTSVVVVHGGIRASARACGVDKTFISRCLAGKVVHPTDETLKRLGLVAVPLYRKTTEDKP